MATTTEIKRYFTKIYGKKKANKIMSDAKKRKKYLQKHKTFVV